MGGRKSLRAAGINGCRLGDDCSPWLVMDSNRGSRTWLTLGDAGWVRKVATLVSPALPDLPEHLCWLGPSLREPTTPCCGADGGMSWGETKLLVLWRPQTNLWGLEPGGLTCRSWLGWGPCDEGRGGLPPCTAGSHPHPLVVFVWGPISAHRWVAPLSSGPACRAVSLPAFAVLFWWVFLHAVYAALHGLGRPGPGFSSHPCANVARRIVC